MKDMMLWSVECAQDFTEEQVIAAIADIEQIIQSIDAQITATTIIINRACGLNYAVDKPAELQKLQQDLLQLQQVKNGQADRLAYYRDILTNNASQSAQSALRPGSPGGA